MQLCSIIEGVDLIGLASPEDGTFMQHILSRSRIIFACFALTLLATGCFQGAGDEAQPNAVSQSRDITSVPAQIVPEVTDNPVIVTETATVIPTTLAVTETEFPTATLSDQSLQFRAGDAVDQPISDLSIGGGTSVAQALDSNNQNEQPDPFELTATELVAQITRTAEAPFTQTAQAQGLGQPTLTFTPNPIFATATPVFVQGIQPTSTPFVAIPGGSCVHQVIAGENLFQLSQRYGVSINEMAAASGITNIQLIFVGDRITIPGCGTTGVIPPATSIPTIVPIAGTDVTGGTGGTNTTTTTTAIVGGRTHNVQQYETLFEISLLYGVPINSISAANGITDINQITIGDVLTIPAQ
ncbi:MAG: LysM peptidoglycan-binding domain-containing protein [Aggregatilineales bacterium]